MSSSIERVVLIVSIALYFQDTRPSLRVVTAGLAILIYADGAAAADSKAPPPPLRLVADIDAHPPHHGAHSDARGSDREVRVDASCA
jgi:hypothetical protein